MSNEQRALIETLKVLGVAAASSIAVSLSLIYIPLSYLGFAAVIALLVFFAKMVYDMNLSQLRSQEILNRLNEKE